MDELTAAAEAVVVDHHVSWALVLNDSVGSGIAQKVVPAVDEQDTIFDVPSVRFVDLED